MPKVNDVQRNATHESYFNALDRDGKPIEHVEIFHTYKTFSTAVVLITVDGYCELTTQQMDGIARRIDPRFRLSTSGIAVDPIDGNKIFRRYTFPQG